jgi:CII-binding regulator of phage lambda lysogenization HflD
MRARRRVLRERSFSRPWVAIMCLHEKQRRRDEAIAAIRTKIKAVMRYESAGYF